MSSLNFKTLFHLSNDTVHIIEIKRLGLPGDSDKSLLFYWLLIKKGHLPQRLTFQGMAENGENQTRDFKEGKLCFGDEIGEFTESGNRTSHQIDVITPPTLSSSLNQSITSYLSGSRQ
ncbi:hypothetical protein [Kiloniella sp.]|uniref:hypothetical protein n=1 Tax=Kiloniella sp. TaxID=1938587 RepID=UPI003B0214EA